MQVSIAWALVVASFFLLGCFGYASVAKSKTGMVVGAVISAIVLNGIASQIFTAVEIRLWSRLVELWQRPVSLQRCFGASRSPVRPCISRSARSLLWLELLRSLLASRSWGASGQPMSSLEGRPSSVQALFQSIFSFLPFGWSVSHGDAARAVTQEVPLERYSESDDDERGQMLSHAMYAFGCAQIHMQDADVIPFQ